MKSREANAGDGGGNAGPVFTGPELDVLKGFVEADPTVMLDEVVYQMYYHTGTMCRTLHRLNFPHKLAMCAALPRCWSRETVAASVVLCQALWTANCFYNSCLRFCDA